VSEEQAQQYAVVVSDLRDAQREVEVLTREVEVLTREVEGYRRALLAHHDLSTLSDEVVREYDFRECPVCRRARGG